ncbi:MAG: hypothetical protein EB072_11225, partial [Betaproteobacteria bacterium]|nr:hypothetical protein [Betaproteobacteria bacterium]
GVTSTPQQTFTSDHAGSAEKMFTDLGVSYNFGKIFPDTKSAKLQLNIFNLFGQQRVTSIAAGSDTAINSTSDQYLFQAPRSFQVSGKVEF